MPNVRQSIQVFIDKELKPDVIRAKFIKTAETTRDGLIASGKASERYDTVVDGDKGRSLGDVQRQIVYVFHYTIEAASFALSYLRTRSYPGGKFARSFWISVGGVVLPANNFSATDSSADPNAEIIIGNLVPYNRRIDVQLIGTRHLNYRTPEGLYEDCSRAVNRQFGNTVKAKRVYDYMFPGKYIPKHTDFQFHSPALIITPR